MSAIKPRSLTIAVFTAIAAGCTENSSAPPSSKSIDLPAILSEISFASGLTIAGAGASPTTRLGTSISTPAPASCGYSASVQGFVCPTVTSNGITFDLTYYLYDAAGHALTSADAAPIASVRTVSDLKGTASIPPANGTSGTIALTDHHDMTLTGLLGDKRTLNGTTSSHHDVSLSGATTFRAVIEGTSVTHDVVLPKEGSSPPWPLSGTITSDFTTAVSHPSPAVTTSTHSVITFTGSNIATIVSTTTTSAGAITTTCTIDLSGAKAPVCS
jgi:hypothetical protein